MGAPEKGTPTRGRWPVLAGEYTALGVRRMREAIRPLKPKKNRFFQLSSKERLGQVAERPPANRRPFAYRNSRRGGPGSKSPMVTQATNGNNG
jgi:GDPmannose 4,6-dehydratase